MYNKVKTPVHKETGVSVDNYKRFTPAARLADSMA